MSAAADKVLRVTGTDGKDWLTHFEFQSSRDMTLPDRTLQYGVLILVRHGLPVQSVIFLLRPEADGPELPGVLRVQLPDGATYLEFHYQVIRVWELPVETFLDDGLGALPLAPLANVTRAQLPGIIRRMEERIQQEAPPDEAGTLWTATYVLMGMRYAPQLVTQLLKGVRNMKESSTYQLILEEGRDEGRAQEAHAILLR